MSPVSFSSSIVLLVASALPLPGQWPEPISPTNGTIIIDGTARSLTRFASIAVGPLGVIVMGQPQDHRFLIHAPDGSLLHTIGREGSGPGELRRPGTPGFLGRDVWIQDNMDFRITIFRGGEVLRTLAIDPRLRIGSEIQPVASTGVLALMQDESTLRRVSMPGNRPFPEFWAGRSSDGDDLAYVMADSTGAVQRVVAWSRNRSRCTSRFERGRIRRPLCADPGMEVSSQGTLIGLVEEDHDPAQGRFRLRLLTLPEGREQLNIVVEQEPIAVPSFVYDSIVDGNAKYFPPEFTRATRALGKPEYFPPVRNLLVSDDGRSAVEIWDAEPAHTWRFFDAKGREVPGVRLPHNETLAALGRGYILVIQEDEDGLQSVVRYRN